jgi:hypothetical protein
VTPTLEAGAKARAAAKKRLSPEEREVAAAKAAWARHHKLLPRSEGFVDIAATTHAVRLRLAPEKRMLRVKERVDRAKRKRSEIRTRFSPEALMDTVKANWAAIKKPPVSFAEWKNSVQDWTGVTVKDGPMTRRAWETYLSDPAMTALLLEARRVCANEHLKALTNEQQKKMQFQEEYRNEKKYAPYFASLNAALADGSTALLRADFLEKLAAEGRPLGHRAELEELSPEAFYYGPIWGGVFVVALSYMWAMPEYPRPPSPAKKEIFLDGHGYDYFAGKHKLDPDLASIPRCLIAAGRWKYVLIEVQDRNWKKKKEKRKKKKRKEEKEKKRRKKNKKKGGRSSSGGDDDSDSDNDEEEDEEETEKKIQRILIVRSYKDHNVRQAYEKVIDEELKPKDLTGKMIGGGYINFDVRHRPATVKIYEWSTAFNPDAPELGVNEIACAIVQESYPGIDVSWSSRHPDPDGEQLRDVVRFLRWLQAANESPAKGKLVLVMWDWASLYQEEKAFEYDAYYPGRLGRDCGGGKWHIDHDDGVKQFNVDEALIRSLEEEGDSELLPGMKVEARYADCDGDEPFAFQRPRQEKMFLDGLQKTNFWYSHPLTMTLMNRRKPSEREHDYDECAWPIFERAVSYLKKDEQRVIDLHAFLGLLVDQSIYIKREFNKMTALCGNLAGATPPISPDAMNEVLSLSHVTESENAENLEDFLKQSYKETFEAVLPTVKELSFVALTWVTKGEWAAFCYEVLPHYANLESLYLQGNPNLEVDIVKLVDMLPPTLRILSLEGTACFGRGGFADWDRLPALEHLALQGTNISTSDWQHYNNGWYAD